jgi:hypothetical protein
LTQRDFFFSLSQVLNNKSLDFTEMCVSLEKLKSLNEKSSQEILLTPEITKFLQVE